MVEQFKSPIVFVLTAFFTLLMPRAISNIDPVTSETEDESGTTNKNGTIPKCGLLGKSGENLKPGTPVE